MTCKNASQPTLNNNDMPIGMKGGDFLQHCPPFYPLGKKGGCNLHCMFQLILHIRLDYEYREEPAEDTEGGRHDNSKNRRKTLKPSKDIVFGSDITPSVRDVITEGIAID